MSIVTDPLPAAPGMEEVHRLYDLGLFRQAWDALGGAERCDCTGDLARDLIVSRLCSQMGLRRRARRIMMRVRRRHPGHPLVLHHFLWHLIELRGPVHARAFLLDHPLPDGAGDLHAADRLLQEAEVLARLRDFPRALAGIEAAARTAPTLRWLPVTRSRVLALMDRHEDSLANARAAQALDPACWQLVGEEAEALVALGRDAEAVEALRAAIARFESPYLLIQTTGLEIELEHWDHATAALDRLEALLPATGLAAGENDLQRWLASRRSDVCWRRGDAAGAAEWARKAGDAESFHGKFAERLAQPPPDARRVVLPVGFTRQQHMTCAPATLAALCRYWNRPAEHLAIANEICFDGTYGHSERTWAERAGWTVREFTVTAAAARALIDRGVPFALSTVDPGNAHAQAVIGYDDFRGTLLIRDPFERSKSEWIEEAAYKSQAPNGPRGMALVPPGEAARLEGLSLGDEAAYDLMHALDSALERHDRAGAQEAARRLQEEHPGHRLAILARLAMASYDQQPAAAVSALDAQLARHPSDVNAALRRQSWRASDAPRETRLAEWEKTLRSPAGHPLLWLDYAREISEDGRRWKETRYWLNRASRRMVRGSATQMNADLLWRAGRFDEALEWYRIASCLEEFNENFALTYFRVAHARGRTAEGMEWLRLRVERHGRRGSTPAQTLAQALSETARLEEAVEVLEEGLLLRPDDAGNRVYTASFLGQVGRRARAREILEEGPVGVRTSVWNGTLAELEERENGPGAALPHWEKAAEEAPLDIASLSGLLNALENTAGTETALERLLARTRLFPHFRPLQRFAADWMSRVSAARQQDFLETYLRAEPDDAWAWREIAFVHLRQSHAPEARRAALRAGEIEPRSPSAAIALAEADLLKGDRAAAFGHMREALCEAIDYAYALRLYFSHCHDAPTRREALDFVRGEIIRQHTNGESVQVFAETAASHLPREEILELLRKGAETRPDLWRIRDSLASHLGLMGRADEAVAEARKGVADFPLQAEPRITLTSLLDSAGRREEARAEVAAALEIDASWAWFHRQRALMLEEDGDFAAAAGVLDPLLARFPRDSYARLNRARLAWKLGDPAQAVVRLTRLVEDEPGFETAWQALDFMARESGDPAQPARLARGLVERRPDEARSWLMLANRLSAPGDFEERLRAYDRALELSPSLVGAVEEKALLLCEAGRIEDALALVRDVRWGDPRPPMLRTREAWILGQLGHTEEALELAEAALLDDPTLFNARLWVMERWLPHDGKDTRALTHANELTQQYPNSADAWCVLGEIRLKWPHLKKKAGEAFERAQILDPRSRRAFSHLFDLAVGDGALPRARERLLAFQPHLPQVARAGFACELTLHEEDPGAFLKAFQDLLDDPGDEPFWFRIIHTHLTGKRAAWQAGCLSLLLRRLGAGEVRSPEAAAFALRLCPNRTPVILNALHGLSEGDETARRGYVQAVSAFGEKPPKNPFSRWRTALRLNRLIARRLTWFSSEQNLWGQAGYALLCLERHRDCAAWLANWKSFPEIQPWMINNLVIAQLHLKDRAAARATVRDALTLPFFDDTIMRFHLLESIWSSLEGDEDSARRHLGLVNPDMVSKGFDAPLHRFATWIVKFARVLPGTKPPARDEMETWTYLTGQLAAYPVLRADLRTARTLRRKAAGRPMWAAFASPGSTDSHSRFVLLLVVFVILRALIQAWPKPDPPKGGGRPMKPLFEHTMEETEQVQRGLNALEEFERKRKWSTGGMKP